MSCLILIYDVLSYFESFFKISVFIIKHVTILEKRNIAPVKNLLEICVGLAYL